MAKSFALSPTWVGGLVVFTFLVGLFYLEPLFSKRHLSFPVQSADENASVFPMNVPLSIYSAGHLSTLKNQKEVSLGDLMKGLSEPAQKRPLLVNFWATWCDPCVEEIPSLNSLSSQLKTQSALPFLITISVDEKKEAIAQLQKTLDKPMQFTILHDPDGAFSRKLGVIKFPETFLIDPQGKILHKWIGPQDWLSLEIIQQLDILRIAN